MPRRCFVSNLQGLAFRLEYFVSCPCVPQEQIQANPLISFGAWVPANRSSATYSPIKKLLKAPLLPTTEYCTKHLRRTLQTLSKASYSPFFHAICNHSLSTSSSIHTKLPPILRHILYSVHAISPGILTLFCLGISSFSKVQIKYHLLPAGCLCQDTVVCSLSDVSIILLKTSPL